MPAIIVNDYTWRQDDEAVVISTKLSGHPKKIDLFAIDNYMKASYPPFILELFLWGTIMEESSECIIGEESAVFILKKKEIGVEWPSLLMEDLDKDKKRAQRLRALEIAQLSAEERSKARSEKRQALQRRAVRAQIDLDTENLNKIQAMRDSHRREAMKDFEEWRNRAEKPILDTITGTVQENRKAYKPPLKWFNDDGQIFEARETNETNSFDSEEVLEGKKSEEDNKEENLNLETTDEPSKDEKPKLVARNREEDTFVESSSSSDSSSSEDNSEDSRILKMSTQCSGTEIDEKLRREMLRRKKKESLNRGKEIVRRVLLNEKPRFLSKRSDGIFEENGVAIPRPRKSCTIDVQFTERKFPTPARESHALEEEEWLEKQAEARRKSGFVSEDLRAEEQDPQWLKDKGDEFFKAGNYLGAISAYSHGIKLSDKMSSLYVNRSAAHYAAENYRRCAEDCSTALELMVPKCEGNRESRARCHARLGASLCKLSAPQHGIPELEEALKLTPENETIKRDLLVAKKYFEIKE